MIESRDIRVALLSGGATEWREAVTPLLLAQTDCLVLPDTADELLSLPPMAEPEIIFICHQPGNHDGMAAARQIRALFAVTPLVLLAAGDIDSLKDAVTVGSLAVLEPPFSAPVFLAAFSRCRLIAHALREKALHVQQHLYRSELLMQSPFCCLFVTTNGLVTSCNNEASRIIGIGADTVPEVSDISRRFFAPHSGTFLQEMEKAIQRHTAWNGILYGRLPDTTVRVYQAITVPLTHIDGTSGMLLTLHDITTVQAERSCLRIELQAARDCLTMTVLSETTSNLIQTDMQDNLAPPVLETFSLPVLLESVTSAGAATLPDYLPQQFRGDAGRLGCALKALYSGSKLFGEGTAHLAIAIKERTLSRMVLQFTVTAENRTIPSDNYQGIADYLATPGHAPHAADGLGAAALLVEQIGGSLLIRTERGRCRTVCCSVPLLTEAAAFPSDSSPVPDSIATPLKALKVLVAEDNLLEQTTLKHLLEGIGCQVIIVGNGREAVEEFDQGEFDVVLMDILMPEMDGFEATRLIREREKVTGGAVPVMALTSYSLKAIQEKCAAVGMNGYLAKPVAKGKLLEALQQLGRPQELSTQAEVKMPESPELPILAPRSVLENLDYDLDTYRELIDLYLTDYAAVSDQLAEKLSGDDLTGIKECAHGLKGIVASIGALRLADTANRIQEMCREGDKPECGVWAPRVTTEAAALKAALEQLDWSALEQLAAEQ